MRSEIELIKKLIYNRQFIQTIYFKKMMQ